MNKARVWFCILVLLVSLSSSLCAAKSVELAKDWSFSWVFKADTIEFTMTAPTTGWVSLGFNPTSRMKGADYILAYVDKGELFLSDEYGTGSTSHKSDLSLGGEDSAKALSFLAGGGRTTITFSLPQNSGDIYDTVFVEGEQCKVIAAYSSSKSLSSRHSKRGSAVIVL
ncbi:MAG: DOMON domain-containing protein [Sphaerochaeta sp.]|nr:DOMON domain-containing protein [Sphaerochaeta sp.]